METTLAIAAKEALPIVSEVATMIQYGLEHNQDAESMGKLYDLYERERNEKRRVEFNRAMAKFQADCPPIRKSHKIVTKSGRKTAYADLSDCLRSARPALAANGLAADWETLSTEDGKASIVCVIRHEGGHEKRCVFPFMQDKNTYNSDLQNVGSGITYAKRYTFLMATGLVADDDTDAAPPTGHEPPDAPPGANNPIDQKQQDTINDLIIQSETERGKFLRYFKVVSLAQFPSARYEEAVNGLLAKIEKAKTK